jgi:hypothetical protein
LRFEGESNKEWLSTPTKSNPEKSLLSCQQRREEAKLRSIKRSIPKKACFSSRNAGKKLIEEYEEFRKKLAFLPDTQERS